MKTYRTQFVARLIEDGDVVAFYCSDDVRLPFVPAVGTYFSQASGGWLWATALGNLMPAVEDIVYDLDNQLLICLFTIEAALGSPFWIRMEPNQLDRKKYPAHFFACADAA